MRPPDLPTTAAHGTRARYVLGCRCAPCTTANRVQGYHARLARARAALADVPASPAVPITKRVGAATRTYARACPGVEGQPCPTRSHLRRDSGVVCGACRDRLVWNGLVDAAPVRRHLQWLARHGVGRRAVADTTDIAPSTVQALLTGRQTQLRAQTARRLLAVDRACVADGARVDAAPAWRQIRALLREGYPARRLAQLLGYTGDGLQFGATTMTAKNVLKVARLYRRMRARI